MLFQNFLLEEENIILCSLPPEKEKLVENIIYCNIYAYIQIYRSSKEAWGTSDP
jgi:hypothetical protein